LSTGSSSRRAAAVSAFLLVLLAPGPVRAQTFKLSNLRLPYDVAAGSWVTYQLDVVAKSRPARHITQRIAVVSREGTGAEAGAWVELKTTEGGRTRTERGYYMRAEGKKDILDSLYADEEPPAAADTLPVPARPQKLRLARYQKLTPDGKLYEYAMEEESTASLPAEDVSAMDMFEFSGRATMEFLPPDTLRAGRKVVPCRVRRATRTGSQQWEGADSTYMNRAQMTQTFWRNPYIPITGIAREVAEVSTVRVPAPGAPPDTTAAAAPPEANPNSDYIYRATIALIDLGKDAVPEITQAPEPAPKESQPRARFLDR
jgi:hypothetical protein